MSADARKTVGGIAIALAVLAAVFVPGLLVLVLVPLAGLLFAAFYARRWAAGDPSGDRRVVASLVVAAAVFVLASIAWILVLFSAAYECEYADVQCSSQAEFLAAHSGWGFLPIAALSLAAGWLVTFPRNRVKPHARSDSEVPCV